VKASLEMGTSGPDEATFFTPYGGCDPVYTNASGNRLVATALFKLNVSFHL